MTQAASAALSPSARETMFKAAVDAIVAGRPGDPVVADYQAIAAQLPPTDGSALNGRRDLRLVMGGRAPVAVASAAEASRLFSQRRDASGRGASQFGDAVILAGDEEVARISYNGRVWHPGADVYDAPLYDPSGAYGNPFADAVTRIPVRFACEAVNELARLAA